MRRLPQHTRPEAHGPFSAPRPPERTAHHKQPGAPATPRERRTDHDVLRHKALEIIDNERSYLASLETLNEVRPAPQGVAEVGRASLTHGSAWLCASPSRQRPTQQRFYRPLERSTHTNSPILSLVEVQMIFSGLEKVAPHGADPRRHRRLVQHCQARARTAKGAER